jgi:hypothetical protein
MTKRELRRTIEKTIEEARTFEKKNPNNPGIIDINRHRSYLEAELDMYDVIHPGPLRSIAISLMFPISLALTPIIIAVGLAYHTSKTTYGGINNDKDNNTL